MVLVLFREFVLYIIMCNMISENDNYEPNYCCS